jgi:hypothetical protein
MSELKSPKNKTYPFDILKRLLDTPQLLPHESSKEFLQLFARLEDYAKPQNSRDYLVVHQATVLTWDTPQSGSQLARAQSLFRAGGGAVRSIIRGRDHAFAPEVVTRPHTRLRTDKPL